MVKMHRHRSSSVRIFLLVSEDKNGAWTLYVKHLMTGLSAIAARLRRLYCKIKKNSLTPNRQKYVGGKKGTQKKSVFASFCFHQMEVVDLSQSLQQLQSRLPAIIPRLADKCAELNQHAGSLSEPSVRYAEQWLRHGDVYYSSQSYEYRGLYRFLQIAKRNTHVLLLATTPGTAIAVLPPKQEWMACDLARPGSGLPAGSGFKALREEQKLARKMDGQSRIFQPQGSSEFNERYLFALLNIVGQDYNTVIIDATEHKEYAFHIQIALKKVTAVGGCFVWRVSTSFLISQEAQTHVGTLLEQFDQVHIATLVDHDRFDTHFIIASERRLTPRQSNAELPGLINRLVDHWVALSQTDYIKQIRLAMFFHGINVRTTADVERHWQECSSTYYQQQVQSSDRFV